MEVIHIEIQTWRTAIKRNRLSKPVQIYKDKIISKSLDMGCGHGQDVQILQSEGYDILGYDKYFQQDTMILKENTYDTVICNYVLNVIPYIDERLMVLHDINDLLKDTGKAYITVRPKREEYTLKHKTEFRDGWLTSIGTFQKFYTAEDLAEEVGNVFGDIKVICKDPVIVEVMKVK